MEEIIEFLTIFHDATKLPLFLFNNKFELIKSFKLAVTPDFPNQYFNKMKVDETSPNSRIYTINTNESFSVIKTSSAKFTYIIIWVNSHTVEQTGYYQDRFPVIGIERLASYTKMLYFSLFQRFPNIHLPKNMVEPADINIPDLDINITNDAVDSITHNSYIAETLMVDSIEHANLAEFNIRLSTFIKSGSYGQMSSDSELRNKKDIALGATTMFTRAAIRGGLNEKIAYQLSDNCCKRIEKRTHVLSVSNLIQEIGTLFIKKMRSYNSKSGSILIYKIQDYVHSHQSERLSLNKLSLELGYSKEYLCKIFKRNTGKTIIDYYNSQRIQDAESLLIYTNKTIGEIATDLGFNDQSYFTKTFIQQKNIGPNKFRHKYHL